MIVAPTEKKEVRFKFYVYFKSLPFMSGAKKCSIAIVHVILFEMYFI